MTFEDEKLLSSWFAIFFVFVVPVNAELFTNFFWKEFLAFGTVYGVLGWLMFKNTIRPNLRFYIWGLFFWGLLLISYSSFALLLLARTFGEEWLWLFTPLWLMLIIMLIRSLVYLDDEMPSGTARSMPLVGVVGASLSGIATFFVSKGTFNFFLALIMDILLSYFMTLAFTIWLRRYLKVRGNKKRLTHYR